MTDSCSRCGAEPVASGATTLLRCAMCGARFAGGSLTSLELELRADPGHAHVEAIVELDPEFRERYLIDRLIGAGGMGMVVLAREVASGRPVAIKFMRLLEQPELADRFQREARLLMNLKHPNVVELLAMDHVGDHPVLVMEYLGGGTLKDRLKAETRLTGSDAVEVILPVLAGLAALHRSGVIHRDLKPENILFSDVGVPKVADLGIAKDYADAGITATGQVLGTPVYMSPEQARGDRPTVSSDIYAIGCMLYELIAGKPPFETFNPLELIRLHQTTEPPPLANRAPDVPAKLAAVIHRALAKPIAERPASCEDLCILLERAVGRDRPSALGEVSGARIPLLKNRAAPGSPAPRPPDSPALAPAHPASPENPALPAPAAMPALPKTPAPAPGSPPAHGPPHAHATNLEVPAHRVPKSVALPPTLVQKPVPVTPPVPFWACAINDGPPFPLAPDVLFIGRSPGPSELILDDPGVSYRHALLVPENAELKIYDFRSTNGLKVNGRPVEQHAFSDGDVVTLGQHRLTFRRTPAAFAAAPDPSFALPPGLIGGWLSAPGDTRDRFGALLDLLMSHWQLARAILLAEHLPSRSFQTLAARPAAATGTPAALRDLPTGRLAGAGDPVLIVSGPMGHPSALAGLRAGEHIVGQLYVEAGPATPGALFAAEGLPTLQGVASLAALAVEMALPRAPAEVR